MFCSPICPYIQQSKTYLGIDFPTDSLIGYPDPARNSDFSAVGPTTELKCIGTTKFPPTSALSVNQTVSFYITGKIDARCHAACKHLVGCDCSVPE